LNASAGVSYNKFLAKIASDLNKPNGQAVILPEDAEEFLEKLPIGKFFGIGKVTTEKMQKLGIHNGKDLKDFSLQFLTKKFGKSGLHYYNIVRGIHLSEVQPHRTRKSLSAENTFDRDLITVQEMEEQLFPIFEEVIRRLEKSGVKGRTITLKLKYSDFTQQTRSKTLEQYPEKELIWEIAKELLYQEEIPKAVRLLGLGVSNLNITEEQTHFGEQLRIPFE
ncbi:MAG TPA: DNA polymerase IV, partial [Algoriphagus sp.]|nr:DNA polymerase IV [Algoriphagus sp.]